MNRITYGMPEDCFFPELNIALLSNEEIERSIATYTEYHGSSLLTVTDRGISQIGLASKMLGSICSMLQISQRTDEAVIDRIFYQLQYHYLTKGMNMNVVCNLSERVALYYKTHSEYTQFRLACAEIAIRGCSYEEVNALQMQIQSYYNEHVNIESNRQVKEILKRLERLTRPLGLVLRLLTVEDQTTVNSAHETIIKECCTAQLSAIHRSRPMPVIRQNGGRIVAMIRMPIDLQTRVHTYYNQNINRLTEEDIPSLYRAQSGQPTEYGVDGRLLGDVLTCIGTHHYSRVKPSLIDLHAKQEAQSKEDLSFFAALEARCAS